jgi:hypothetical protein
MDNTINLETIIQKIPTCLQRKVKGDTVATDHKKKIVIARTILSQRQASTCARKCDGLTGLHNGSTGTPSPGAPGRDVLKSCDKRASISRPNDALRTRSRPVCTATCSRCTPLG